MAEWLYEEGIGENRAILVAAGAIVEAAIELPGQRAGTILRARLKGPSVAELEDGGEAMIEAPGLAEGARFNAEVVREPMPELGRPKPARVRPTEQPPRLGPTLRERVGDPEPWPRHGPDRFEEAGWSELLDEAASGEIAFPGGALRMSLTPAMVLFDVDGGLAPAELAVAGAEAAARAIRRFGLAGSIGIDLPTLPRGRRQEAAAALDAILPQPFERTAVNGFGFLQIVRRKLRPSLPEIIQADPAGAAARALLRRAERITGPVTIRAAPAVIARIGEDWQAALARRIGGAVALRAEPGLAISAGHVEGRP